MAALTSARDTKEVYCNALCIHRVKTLATGTSVYTGSICAVNSSGNAVPASDTAGLVVIGRAEAFVSDTKLIAKSGVFIYDNATSTEALTVADINKKVFVIDDHTVGKTGGTNKIPAGTMRDILPDGGIVVEIGNNSL